ncbi:MAG: glycosyltransferase family 4 protein [Phycisphaerales bacterium]|jgi:glycosyltransferase involved in cell wall biosynthesis|nr:glycosyltransferase family 4 protein [Phycisphaerales bacterium]
MKIGVYVSVIAGQKGFENNVSGHIQVPLRAIDEMRKAGHEVHLITNEYGEDRSLPFCLPKDINMHLVTDSRKRGGILERKGNQNHGLSLFQLFKQISEIKRICKNEKFDVLHLFGYNRTAHLGAGLRILGLSAPVVVTIFSANFPEKFSFLTKRLWKRVNAVVTATKYAKGRLEEEGIPTKQVRHGVIRNLLEEHDGSETEKPRRVLFWRDMTQRNGADVALAAYSNLSEKYPDIQFDFAVRPHWNPIEDVEKISEKYQNINVYNFPYEEGITLPKLLLESICVVMPIRNLSIDPQLVIAETLAIGIPVITTNQRSNPEFVIDGETGYLTEIGDIEATTNAIDKMLSNREEAIKMGRQAKKHIETCWNWDNYSEDIVEIYKQVID